MLPTLEWPYAALSFLLGALVGSFLNVCIVRWPDGGSVVRPASRCPRCERAIRWYENVPIVSWLALRGRCRGCGLPISPLYPAIELTTALVWLACAAAFGFGFEALRLAVFATVLLGIAATDARRYLIPDGFTVFLLVWTLGTAVVTQGPDAAVHFAGPYEALVGACAGAGAIAIIGWLGELAFKKEAMGFGDVTMMAGVGAALGPERALLTVIVGAFVGAVASVTVLVPAAWLLHRRRTAARGAGVASVAVATPAVATPAVATLPGATEEAPAAESDDDGFELPLVPFGVFLAPAALLTLLFGDRMIAWYFAAILPS